MANKSKLIETALSNLKSDRDVTNSLLEELRDEILSGKTSHGMSGQTAAKYVETLQRSNEQLVKIIAILDKRDKSEPDELSKTAKNDIYDEIKEEN